VRSGQKVGQKSNSATRFLMLQIAGHAMAGSAAPGPLKSGSRLAENRSLGWQPLVCGRNHK
jgi:hypothetical protein